ncbi:MAG: hypothetical protein KJ655_06380 [Candidatus Thermoplasmatota archaeon]|nr:hypothetical protein [Candidatus Thermoplasmatota archaeon]
MLWYIIPSFIGAFVSIILGVYVFYKRGKDDAGRVFFFLMMGCALWNIGEFMMQTSSDVSSSLLWAKISNVGFILIPSFLLHFTFVYPTKSRKKVGMLYLLPAVLIIFTVFTNTFFTVAYGDNLEKFRYVPGEYYFVLLLFFFGYIIGAVLNLMNRRLEMEKKEKKQALHLSIGLIAIIGYILILFGGAVGLPGTILDSFLTLVMASFFAYVTIRYQLFDIRIHIFLRKTLIYLTTFSLIIILFLILIISSAGLVKNYFISNQPFFYLGMLFIGGVLLEKMNRGATLFVEHVCPSLKWEESKVGEVFLINKRSGVIISHIEINPQIKIDPDLVAGMLTAVNDFLADTLKIKGKGLNVLSYGGVKLMIEHGECAYMVVIFTGYEIEGMRKDVRKTIETIDKEYSDVLMKWDGNVDKVKDVDLTIREMMK